ncbi:MAG TPA: hypothetical protein P5081_07315 [Phycisphaerae bacterium]|nr:hypothetical protein [Phycisphaerae bacterium]HRW52679.1 hypothetical protein [Phycisphaerae bacterium]
MSLNDALSAARRTEQVWWEQICDWESLEYGVAFTCARYPSVADAQQLRDVWLAEIDGAEAMKRADAYYAERSLSCNLWTPASGQDAAQVESFLASRGWRTESSVVLALANIDAGPDDLEYEGIRILPARAMRRAYRAFLETLRSGDADACDAAFDRLDDASYEVLLAVRDGAAIGAIGYHEVGDFARLRDFSVFSDPNDDAVRRLLLAHELHRVRRMAPRVVVAVFEESATDDIAFLCDNGFAEAGRLPAFRRSA